MGSTGSAASAATSSAQHWRSCLLYTSLAYLRQPEVDDDEGAPRKKKFSYPPQLLIVDGGQPQVAAAQRALDEAGVTGIRLAGIAKRLEEIWLPDTDYPCLLYTSRCV